jgi:hypothetical protein
MIRFTLTVSLTAEEMARFARIVLLLGVWFIS